MATTTGGSTYVTSTDLVANYPTASLALANRVDVVASGQIVYNTGNYTITVADILGGKTIVQNSASGTTVTLPSSSLVDGMQAKIANVGTGTVTVSGGTLLGTATISQYGGITAVYKTSITSWWLLPFSASVGAANFTNTATGTYTGYKYLTFTGNGTITIDRAGLADILIIGGGGGGGGLGGGGGGAGQYTYRAGFYLAADTYNVVIGGGGTAGSGGAGSALGGGNGNYSYIAGLTCIGGGGGGSQAGVENTGKSQANGGGGGGGSTGSSGGSGLPSGGGFSGYSGGSGATDGTTYRVSGGGGGAGGAGGNASGPSTQGAAGPGVSNSITGSAVTRGAGAAGGTGSAGTANTGNGGNAQQAGGSGVVIVRVAV